MRADILKSVTYINSLFPGRTVVATTTLKFTGRFSIEFTMLPNEATPQAHFNELADALHERFGPEVLHVAPSVTGITWEIEDSRYVELLMYARKYVSIRLSDFNKDIK